MREIKKIEKFFLVAVLRIAIAGAFIILVTDVIFTPEDTLSVSIDAIILASCIISFMIRDRYFTLSALLVTGITLMAMFYQCLVVPINTTTSFSIILIVGFLLSILLKGRLLLVMHSITFIGIAVIFVLQMLDPTLGQSRSVNDIATMAMTYLVLYLIVSYCTGILKSSYDHIQQYLRNANIELQDKSNEIAAQNEELLQIQDNLHELNTDLERMVNERTDKIKAQNEILLKYTYTNAHHLRGPVARLLGLVAVHRLEPTADPAFFFDMMEEQAKEIDEVVQKINDDLQVDGHHS